MKVKLVIEDIVGRKVVYQLTTIQYMKKNIKKIATSGIVGTLLFVSSGTVRAENSPAIAKTSQKNEVYDSEILQDDTSVDIGVSANDEIRGEGIQDLLEQGFSPAQIQKLNRWSEED